VRISRQRLINALIGKVKSLALGTSPVNCDSFPSQAMHSVSVQIVRFVDGNFPGWVECELVDADDRRHVLNDKIPIFTGELLDAHSEYPTPGSVRCEVVERFRDEEGRELVRVSTWTPDGIESTEGVSEFTVLASIVTSVPD